MAPLDDLIADMLVKVEAMRKSLEGRPGKQLMQRDLEWVESRLRAGNLTKDDVEQIQFMFNAHAADLGRSLSYRSVMFAILLDSHERRDPERFANDARAQRLLRDWRDPEMRERLLSELTIEERGDLEEKERQWRDKPPGA